MTVWRGNRPAWPLRRRLLVAALGLCAAGLAVFTASSVLLLEQSLLGRADGQLRTFAAGLQAGRPAPPPPDGDDAELPTDFSLHVYSASGEFKWRAPRDDAGAPALSREAVLSAGAEPTTVPDAQDGTKWRTLVIAGPSGDRVVIALSLQSLVDTVNQLLVIEVGAGLLILVLVAWVGRVVVRLGLRPLTRMESTAVAIAGGKVDLRVADGDPRTETGRLGRALNTMLTRLRAAMREREISEQRLRRFVADASHELRTPLTSIRGFAELYRHGEARDPDAARALRRIEDEAARMGAMVDDLQLLARLDREPGLDLSEVDLGRLVEDVVHDALARHPGRSIGIETPEHRTRVVGDGHRLHQVVANLVGNALTHAGPDADVRVRLDPVITGEWREPGAVVAGNELPAGVPAVRVDVADDGPGIPAEHLRHVFDRFYRANTSRSGTGLGLAICAALAEAHDGQIQVVSEPGAGTTFRVVLPVAGPEAP